MAGEWLRSKSTNCKQAQEGERNVYLLCTPIVAHLCLNSQKIPSFFFFFLLLESLLPLLLSAFFDPFGLSSGESVELSPS